jgi:hypothetical protein
MAHLMTVPAIGILLTFAFVVGWFFTFTPPL